MRNSTGIVPASVSPDGVIPNFENPEDVYYTANLVNLAVCVGITNAVFLVHAYVKLAVKTADLLHEDWFCVAAWVRMPANLRPPENLIVVYGSLLTMIVQLFVNGFYAMNLGMSHFGEGRNIWELSLYDYRALLKFMYMSTTLYTPAAFCTKVTLLLLIARVFSVHPMICRLIHIFIITIFLAYLPIAILKIFICKPIPAYWENFEMTDAGAVTGGNSSCLGQATLFMGDISISIVTDVIILILPIIMAWRMEASWQKKLKITVLLGAGGAATVTTVVRAYFNVQFMHTTNASKDFALSSITSVLELGIGLSCACLPSVNLLWEKWTSSQGSLSRFRRSGKGPNLESSTACTASEYWSSLKSKILLSTVRTMTNKADHETRITHQRSVSETEMGTQLDVVVFNKRLDVPSIASMTDERSRSSRCEDHRGVEDQDSETHLHQNASGKHVGGGPWKQDSVIAIDSG